MIIVTPSGDALECRLLGHTQDGYEIYIVSESLPDPVRGIVATHIEFDAEVGSALLFPKDHFFGMNQVFYGFAHICQEAAKSLADLSRAIYKIKDIPMVASSSIWLPELPKPTYTIPVSIGQPRGSEEAIGPFLEQPTARGPPANSYRRFKNSNYQNGGTVN